MQVLPNLADGHWTFNGTAKLGDGLHAGKDADAYVWVVTEDYGYGKVVASYTFFVDQVSANLALSVCQLPPGLSRPGWQ